MAIETIDDDLAFLTSYEPERASLIEAKKYEPQKFEQALSDAELFMVPPEVAYENKDILEQENFDFKSVLGDAPKTQAFLNNPEAKAIWDKLPDLAEMERKYGKGDTPVGQTLWGDMAQNIEAVGVAYSEMEKQYKYNDIKSREASDILFGTNSVSPDEIEWASNVVFEDAERRGTGSTFSKMLTGGAGFVYQQEQNLKAAIEGGGVGAAIGAAGGAVVGGAGGFFTGGPAGATAGAVYGSKTGASWLGRQGAAYKVGEEMFYNEWGSAFAEYENITDINGNKINRKDAALASMLYGIGSSSVELFATTGLLKLTGKALEIGPLKAIGSKIRQEGLKAFLRDPANVSAMRAVAEKLGLGVATTGVEGAEEGVQSLLQTTIQNVLQDAQDIDFRKGYGIFTPVDDQMAQAWGAMKQSFYSTALFSAGVGVGGAAISIKRSPETAAERQQRIAGLNKFVREKKFADTPIAFNKFSQSVDDGTTYYIPSSSVEDFLTRLSPEKREAFDKAIPDIDGRISDSYTSGADLEFTQAEYLTGFAPHEEADSIVPNIKNDPAQFTESDVKEFNDFAKGNAKTILESLKDVQDDDTTEMVANRVKRMAVASGRTAQEAEGVGKIVAKMLTQEARVTGERAIDLFNKQFIGINAATEGGDVVRESSNFDQILSDIRKIDAGKRVGKDRKEQAEAFRQRLVDAGLGERINTITGSEAADVLFPKQVAETLEQKGFSSVDDLMDRLESVHGVQASISERNDSIYLASIKSPDKGQGYGTKAMEDIIAYADKAGKRITLTPTKDFGATSVGRLKNFYKRFGFVENKGKNKDFSVSDAMYREPKKRFLGLFQSAYHGSPYRFERFDLSKIGTGEGAQAYGYGIYFAENLDVAKSYSPRDAALEDALQKLYDKAEAREDYVKMEVIEEAMLNKTPQEIIERFNDEDFSKEHRKAAKEVAAYVKKNSKGSQAYKVEIPDADIERMLDWDKPLIEQGNVAEIINRLIGSSEGKFKPSETDQILADLQDRKIEGSGMEAYKTLSDKLGSDKAASEALAKEGIVGIKYLDGTSRGKGEGTRNFVVFDQALLDKISDSIETLYQGERASIQYQDVDKIIISLKGKANFSSLVHEVSHWAVLRHKSLVEHISANPDIVRDKYEAERIQNDWNKLLKFVGSTNGELTTEQHEQIAAAFEAYVREGKAPSKDLASTFARFKDWFVNLIYKDVRDIVGFKGIDDEVRGVFDRWLATKDEIDQVKAINESLSIVADAFGDTSLSTRIRDYIARAYEKASDKVYSRMEREQKRLESQTYQEAFDAEKKVAIAQLERQPVYGLIKYLKDNGLKLYVGAFGLKVEQEAASFVESEPMTAAEFDALQAQITLGLEVQQHKDDIIQELVSPVPKRPRTLLEFIRQNGGIKDDRGDIKSMGGKSLLRKNGMSIDDLRGAAVEAGYLAKKFSDVDYRPTESEINDLLEAISEELGGNLVFSEYDQSAVEEYNVRQQLEEYADKLGISQADIEQAKAERTKYGWRNEIVTTENTAEGATDPNIVAEMFGYKNGAEMLKAVRAAKSIEHEAGRMARRILKETYGDMLEGGKIRAVARADSYTSDSIAALDLMAQEAGKRAGIKTDNLRTFAQRLAKNMASRMTIRQLAKAKRFDVAREKAQRDALVAAKKGDWQGALVALQQAMVNHEMFWIAAEFEHRKDKFNSLLRKINVQDKKLPKSWSPDFVYAARAILSNFGLTRSNFDLKKWFGTLEPETMQRLEQLVDLERFKPKKFNDLSYFEFADLADTVANLIHVGRIDKEIEREGKRIKIEDANAELTEAMERANEKSGQDVPAIGANATYWQRTKAKFHEYLASQNRVEAFSRWVDKDNIEGPFARLLYRPVSEAANASKNMRDEKLVKMYGILKPHIQRLKGKKIYVPELATENFSGEFRDKWDLVCLALNTGSRSSLRVLLGGYGWTYEKVQAALDKHLTAEDMDLVQSIWDFLESDIKPFVVKEYKDRTGLMLEEVEPQGFTFKGKEYRGGYYPLEHDRQPLRSVETAILGDDDALIVGDRTSMPTYPSTRNGASIARTGAIYPVSLNISTLYKHVDDAIHSAMVGRVLYEAHRIINYKTQEQTTTGPTTRKPLLEALGRQNRYWANMFNTWLVSVGRNAMAHEVERGIAGRMTKWMKARTVIAYIGYNIVTAAQSFSSLPTLVPEEIGRSSFDGKHKGGGAKYTMLGVMRFASAPQETISFIKSMSPEMVTRFERSEKKANRAFKSIARGSGKAGEMAEFLRDNAFIADEMVDLIVSGSAWMGAFQKAMDNGATDNQAVEYADRVVRNAVIAGQVKDSAAIQRGDILSRALAMFTTYTNMLWNKNALRLRQFRTGDIKFHELIGSMVMINVLPSIMSSLIVQALKGGQDDDEDKEWMVYRQMGDIAGQFPVVGPLATAAVASVSGLKFGDSLSNPVFGASERAFYSLKTLSRQVEALAQGDDADMSKLFSSAVTVSGFLANVPVTPLTRTGATLIDWLEGDSEPESPADAVQKLVGGTR